MADSALPKRFRVLEEVSRDDLGMLFRARDELLNREVVIRYPSPDSDGPVDLSREMREARALARVQHPGVVRLLDVLETDSGPALVMEPVAGETLREVLEREKRLPPRRVRSLAIELCKALEAVHEAGVVHRGVSSANILLRSDGSPCLTGFVFAKFGREGTSLHGTTFDYLTIRKGGADGRALPPAPPHPAPEQVLGQSADARADVFGLGWVLYECLTGSGPYPFDHPPDQWPAPVDPRRSAPDVPKALADIVLRCLNPSPMKRTGSARDVRQALEALGVEVDVRAADTAHRAVKRTIPATAAGMVVLATCLTALFLRARAHRDDKPVEAAEESRGVLPKETRSVREGRAAVTYTEQYARSRALLIGIGEIYAEHGFPALPNAERDVAALEERLEAISSSSEHWDVATLRGAEATHDNILGHLSSLTDAAADDDKIFLYFAGHGTRHDVSEKSGWIIPADGVGLEQDPSRKTWVRFEEFGHLFDESRAKHVLVAMDCCYGGRLAASRSASGTEYSRRLLSEPAKIVISSGRPNEQVSDGIRGEHSPFASAFLDQLSRTDVEAVTTTDIFAGIQRRFLEEEVVHLPVKANPPGASPSGEVVFFLK